MHSLLHLLRSWQRRRCQGWRRCQWSSQWSGCLSSRSSSRSSLTAKAWLDNLKIKERWCLRERVSQVCCPGNGNGLPLSQFCVHPSALSVDRLKLLLSGGVINWRSGIIHSADNMWRPGLCRAEGVEVGTLRKNTLWKNTLWKIHFGKIHFLRLNAKNWHFTISFHFTVH